MTWSSLLEPYSIKEPGESSSNLAISEINNSATATSDPGISKSSTVIYSEPWFFGNIVILPSLWCSSAISVLFKLIAKWPDPYRVLN